MTYATLNFVLIDLFPQNKHMCIYLTNPDFNVASAILWNEEGAWIGPGNSPPQITRRAEIAEQSVVTTSQ